MKQGIWWKERHLMLGVTWLHFLPSGYECQYFTFIVIVWQMPFFLKHKHYGINSLNIHFEYSEYVKLQCRLNVVTTKDFASCSHHRERDTCFLLFWPFFSWSNPLANPLSTTPSNPFLSTLIANNPSQSCHHFSPTLYNSYLTGLFFNFSSPAHYIFATQKTIWIILFFWLKSSMDAYKIQISYHRIWTSPWLVPPYIPDFFLCCLP